jgi:chromosome segregation ATPase
MCVPMIKDLTSINAFPTGPSLSDLIQPLKDEIDQLREEIDQDRQEIADLRAKLAALEKDRDTLSENQLIQLRLIHGLKEKATKDPGKTVTSRSEKIEKYLASRPDHKSTFESLKGVLQINNVLLNQAIKTLMNDSPGRYIIAKSQGDKRKRTLIMLPK